VWTDEHTDKNDNTACFFSKNKKLFINAAGIKMHCTAHRLDNRATQKLLKSTEKTVFRNKNLFF